jgi:hypothetical protein
VLATLALSLLSGDSAGQFVVRGVAPCVAAWSAAPLSAVGPRASPPGKRVRERSGTSSNQESCFGSRRRRATNYKNVERRMTARASLAFRRLSLQSETLLEEVETERGAHLSQLRTPRHRAPAPTQLCHSWPEAWLGLATACSTVSCSPCAPGTGVSFRSRIAKRVAHRRRPNAIHADEPAEGGLAARARFHLPPSSAPARFR